MDLICKPHHHWTRHNVAVILLIIFRFLSASFSAPHPPPPSPSTTPLRRLVGVSCRAPSSPVCPFRVASRPRHARHDLPKSAPFSRRLRFCFGFSFCFFCQWSVLCLKCWSLVYRRKKKKKQHLQPIAMHLTQTGISSRPLGCSDSPWSRRKISHVVTIGPLQWDHPSQLISSTRWLHLALNLVLGRLKKKMLLSH